MNKACLGVALVALTACAERKQFVALPPPEPLRAEAPPPLPGSPLGAREAVRIALARNPDLAAAAARIEQARAQMDFARTARYPVVGLDTSLLAGDAPSAYLFKRIDARNLQAGTDFNHPGDFANVEAGLSVRWNLWNGGRDQLGEWSAESAVEAVRLQRRAIENQLAAAVLTTFLQARAAEELLAADEASIRVVQSQVQETRVKVEGGGALRSDLLSLEVRLADATERRFRTDVARQTALAVMRHLLALPPGAKLELASDGLTAEALPGSGEEALAEAYRSRPEVAAARKSVERARIELERARRGRQPRVDLEGRWYGDDEGLALDSNWTIAVALSWDLYDAGRTPAAVRQARAALEEVEEADRKALLDVALDVETSWLRMGEARARYEVAAQAVGAAEESLDLVEKQYRGGSVTVTRFLEAEEALAQARGNRIGARLDVERAMVDAARSIGRMAVEGS